MTHTQALESALRRLLAAYIHERDCLFDSVSSEGGTICDPEDAEAVAEMDVLIDECRGLLPDE